MEGINLDTGERQSYDAVQYRMGNDNLVADSFPYPYGSTSETPA